MEILKTGIKTAYDIANININLFGYDISFWKVFLFTMFGGMLIAFFRKLME